MKSIGPESFGIDVFDDKISLRLPLKLYNKLQLMFGRTRIAIKSHTNIEILTAIVGLLNQYISNQEISRTLTSAIISIPLVKYVVGWIQPKVGISSRARPGESMVAGVIHIEQPNGE